MTETLESHSPCWGCGVQVGSCEPSCKLQWWKATEVKERVISTPADPTAKKVRP